MNGTHALPLSPARWQLKAGLIESVCTLAVLALLFWQSEPFRESAFGRGAGDRYQQALELKVQIPWAATGASRVAAICERFGAGASEAEREILARACGSRSAASANIAETDLDPVLAALTEAHRAV